MAGSEAECKPPMFIRVVEMKAAVVPWIVFVTDPLAIRVNMRSMGVAFHIAKSTLIVTLPFVSLPVPLGRLLLA